MKQVICALQDAIQRVWATLPRQLRNQPQISERYAACVLLSLNQIHSSPWYDDVLQHYGGPVATSELYLLVHNPVRAAHILTQDFHYRLVRTRPLPTLRAGSLGHNDILLKPRAGKTNVVLLPAHEWHFDMQRDAFKLCQYPGLPAFLEALTAYSIAISAKEHTDRLDTMEYVADLILMCRHMLHAIEDEKSGTISVRHHEIVLPMQSDQHLLQHDSTEEPVPPNTDRSSFRRDGSTKNNNKNMRVRKSFRRYQYSPALPPLVEMMVEA